MIKKFVKGFMEVMHDGPEMLGVLVGICVGFIAFTAACVLACGVVWNLAVLVFA